MDKQELLYDHYKDTCEIQRSSLTTRNKLFVYVLVILGILILMAYKPDTIGGVLVEFVKTKYSIDVSFSLGLLQSVLWVFMLYVSVRYFQSSIYIEKTYRYIHSLEKSIQDEVKVRFDREGYSYLAYFPKCSDVIDVLYKFVFPFLYIIGALTAIVFEIRLSLGFALDCMICLVAVILCILYISFNVKIAKEYKKQSDALSSSNFNQGNTRNLKHKK